MSTPLIRQCKFFGEAVHEEANHTIEEGGETLPYSYHLGRVAFWCREFSDLLTPEEAEIAEAAAWVHDCIEDARQTYNDVVKGTGSVEVAEVAFRLTTEKGRTRAERANEAYYKGIREHKVATFVKLADRLANVEFAVNRKSRMVEVYRKELPHFVESILGFNPKTGWLYNHPFGEMAVEIYTLLGESYE